MNFRLPTVLGFKLNLDRKFPRCVAVQCFIICYVEYCFVFQLQKQEQAKRQQAAALASSSAASATLGIGQGQQSQSPVVIASNSGQEINQLQPSMSNVSAVPRQMAPHQQGLIGGNKAAVALSAGIKHQLTPQQQQLLQLRLQQHQNAGGLLQNPAVRARLGQTTAGLQNAEAADESGNTNLTQYSVSQVQQMILVGQQQQQQQQQQQSRQSLMTNQGSVPQQLTNLQQHGNMSTRSTVLSVASATRSAMVRHANSPRLTLTVPAPRQQMHSTSSTSSCQAFLVPADQQQSQQSKLSTDNNMMLSQLQQQPQMSYRMTLDLPGLVSSGAEGDLTPLTPQDQLSRYVEQL